MYRKTRENILSDNALSEEVKQKELEYVDYVDDHIARVKETWDEIKNSDKMMSSIIKVLAKNIYDVLWIHDSVYIAHMTQRISRHDESKYLYEEWDAYRKNFYPINDEEKEANKEAFEKAWKHHYTRNLHHWEFWVGKGEMSLEDVIEMCCDWIAMSKKFNSNAYEWYRSQTDIVLTVKAKYSVELILRGYYKIIQNIEV